VNQYSSIDLPPQRVMLRVAHVALLDQRGAFRDYHRVELIDGQLLYVNAEFRPHMVAKSELAYRIRRALEAIGSTLFVGIEGSVALSDYDMPQPDIVLTAAPDGDGPIPAASVALVVEVSDATLAFDTGRKLALYARAGIPEYWVVDVNTRTVLVHSGPTGDAYAQQAIVPFGDPVSAVTITRLTVDTATL
jgi:Uma2 family endonuclease